MVQVNGLTASPAILEKADVLPLHDDSSGVLVQVNVEQLVAPTVGGITATGLSLNLGAVGSTWTKVTAFSAATGLANGVTESHASDQLTVTTPHTCLIIYTITVSNSLGTRQIGARIAVDGTAVAGSYGHEVTTAATAVGSISGHAIVSLAATEVVTLETCMSSGTSSGDLSVHEASLTIVPICPSA